MHEMREVEPVRRPAGPLGARLALALGGGAARGLAHIGVLEVLEREGIRPDCLVGSSMGGLIGGLSAAGLEARDLGEVARGFRFPRWFIPGGIVKWDTVFAPAVPILTARSFEELDPAVHLRNTALAFGPARHRKRRSPGPRTGDVNEPRRADDPTPIGNRQGGGSA